jgi:L-ascorbate metabolism protein UlaG (beta-lactamase superfamily)
MSEPLYLKQHILVEPLFNQWYAWSYVMAPHTAAMCVANLHVKIMQSFVSAPQLHVNAVQNPAMLGGPFMNYGEDRVGDVKRLLDWTLKEQGHMIQFAEGVKQLEDLLLTEANGFALEPLYEKVPEALRGYVELVYDLHNRPSVRFLEGLLYRSPYYSPISQSVALSAVTQDERPFVLSTPRLEDDTHIHLKLPWNHPGLDEMVKMKAQPNTFARIKEALELPDQHDALFQTFLTDEAPKAPEKYTGDGMRVRYLGHACVLIETKDVSILTDPFISYEYPTPVPRTTFADLPETLDYILITHAHSDHTALETLLQLRHKTKHIVVPKSGGGALQDPSIKLLLQHAGFPQVIESDEMDRMEFPGGAITCVPFYGEHGDLNIRTKLAYHVESGGKSILCASDSNNVAPELYDHLRRAIGDIDVLFIGMECHGAPMSWLYGPLLTKPLARRMDQTRRLDGSDSAKGIRLINSMHPKEVYVYAMGQEPWTNHVMAIVYDETSPQIVESDKLIEECRSRGMASERLFLRKDIYV